MKQKDYSLLILLFLFIIAALCSCGSNHYSPLDNYIKAVNDAAKANDSAKVAAQQYIDSLNK